MPPSRRIMPNGNPPPLAKGIPPPEAAPDPASTTPSAPSTGISQTGNGTDAGKNAGAKTKSCDDVRRKGKFIVFFKSVDIVDLIQTVSNATCKTFILGDNVRGKISIIGPDNGRGEVDADQFYAAFLAALDANNLTVYPYGKFLKIIEKNKAKQSTLPTIVEDGEEGYTTNEQMVTKLIKLKYAELEPVRGVLQNLVSPGGDTIPYPPDTIIVNDLGSNLHRLEKIVAQLDTKSSSDEIRIIPVKYASASDLAGTIQKLFEQKNNKPAGRGTVSNPVVLNGGAPGRGGELPPATSGTDTASAGPVTLSQVIPEERTNKLIVQASPAAFARIEGLIQALDVPVSGEGRISVYALANANAEDIAATLQSLTQGTTNRPRGGGPGGQPGGGGAPPRPAGVTAAELFAGEVKISPDKATNSLVVVASQNDYRSLVRVIEKLDIPRRQVFVEAVIMEVNLDRKSDFGLELHQGYQLKSPEGTASGIIGTNYNKSAVPPSFSLASLASQGGLLAGIQGPPITALSALGVNFPSFGIVLHALQQSSDVNVLSTPHLLTSDNEEAEITVGQNVPFQSGFNPSSLSGAAAATTGANPAASTGLGLLGGLGGLSSLYAPINRQNVELKLTIKPQINESKFIRLVINEQTEEIASSDPVLGPTTSKRTAKTTVVAKDQETVVIGGIMQERTIQSVNKIPILGDIPLLGNLFRQTTNHKVKTNLLLFLTPYIIQDQSDFRRIFERKMQERQQFVEQFYGQTPGYDVPVDFNRKAGPLAKMNQAVLKEELKLENGGPGMPNELLFKPGGTPGAPSTPTGTSTTLPSAQGMQAAPAGTPTGAVGPSIREPALSPAPDAPPTREAPSPPENPSLYTP